MKIKKICCIGAGYVGGPTMAIIAQKNPNVNFKFVLPRDQNKIHTINSNNVTGMYYEKFDPGMRS